MTYIARRSIEELLARYELEPELKDIYVEGVFDKEILTNYMNSIDPIDVKIYEIETINVPDDLVISQGLTTGNKQRVLVLSRELSKLPDECSCYCLVDKDLDHWFDKLEENSKLIWTEFCSIELSFWKDEILKDIILTTAKSKITMWEEYIQSIIDILRDLYCLRLADRELAWCLDWLPMDKCLSHEGSKVILNLNEYITRLLNKNTKSSHRKEFEVLVSNWKDKLNGDHRDYIRGHDFVEMLAWTIGRLRGVKEFSSIVAVERLLVLLAPKASGVGKIFEHVSQKGTA